MDLSITVISFKSKELIKELLQTIQESQTSYTWEVIVVDNGSGDDTVEVLQNEYGNNEVWKDKFTIIPNTNVGYSKGHNLALSRARGDYWLILNPDMKLFPNTIQELMNYMQSHQDVGIITPKLIKGDGTFEAGCRRSLPNPWNALGKFTGFAKLFPNNKKFSSYNISNEPEDKEMEIEACSGSFMLIRPECKNKIKGFDEDFFMYGEDLDLCKRAREAGFKIWYYPKAEAIHYKGQSSKQVSFWMLREFHKAQWVYYKKHFGQQYNVFFSGLVWVANWGLYLKKVLINTIRREKFVSK